MPDILIFASNNAGKLAEIQALSLPGIELISLREAGIEEDIPEPFNTFRENAWAKASYIYRKTGRDCFAEDSGLVVPALGGEPGVFSARYAGEKATDADNNHKLMDKIRDLDRPMAYYQATICLIRRGTERYFEGRCTGTLLQQPRGTGGFGYDPLFLPEGQDLTFAELPIAVKNTISHRSAAMLQLAQYFQQAGT